MQRQPLAEQTARVEPEAHGLEVLQRIQRARSAARWMEVVRHDHVVAAIACAHVTARVGRYYVKPGFGRAAFGIAGEAARRGDHLRQELDRIDVERRIVGSYRGGDASPEPEEQRAPRSRVKQ